ncbi:hypothetical protein ACEE90_05755 [Corynebacterium phoceense]|uniref:hypothetical protein n=1 Tax=Corynebacterium phoceense TaxID=1686286 RepID=UPI001DE1EE59|nr:hypothetical protein [Corynebacterium phoceense]MCQ9335342.1 hypothetical protein [Corynebacterium phoceense]HJG43006.1 hypothetical protein [Corynebacterium phoceense]
MTLKNTKSSVLADLWARNNEGVAALIAALEEALTSPAKIAALATIELPAWGRLFDWRWTRAVEVAMPAAVGAAYGDPQRHPEIVAAGLAASLGVEEKNRSLARPTTWGAAGVVSSQLAYANFLRQRGARGDAASYVMGGLVAAIGLSKAAMSDGTLRTATGVGALSTAVLVALANDGMLRAQSPAAAGLSHGANLLAASEALTFLRAWRERNDKKTWRVAGAAEVATRGIGKLLLMRGVAR